MTERAAIEKAKREGTELFVSAVRSKGDLAGVFEYDGETGYFYLYDQSATEGKRILNALHILSGQPDFTKSDVKIKWSYDEQKVGLLIRDQLWAVFNGREGLGGNYKRSGRSDIPASIASAFELGD